MLLSGRGEKQAQRAEQALIESGADWTIARSAFFAQNFSEKAFVDSIRGGMVTLPAPEVGEPFVDADYVADVVVTALTEDGHSEQLYELTGPRLLTFAEAVAEIAKAAGREVRYLKITPEQFMAALTAEGLPGEPCPGTAAEGLRRLRAGHRHHGRLEPLRRTTCWNCLGA